MYFLLVLLFLPDNQLMSASVIQVYFIIQNLHNLKDKTIIKINIVYTET